MKLLIALSVIACSYAAKLDRTYLPPASAATAGGSPGALDAPLGSGAPGFGQATGPSRFGQSISSPSGGFRKPSGQSFDNQPGSGFDSQSFSFGPSGLSGSSGAPETYAGFNQPAQGFGGQAAQDYQRTQPQRAQATAEKSAEILRYDNQNDGDSFAYSFETSNGIAAEESGVATNGVQAQGAFSYSDDDGQTYRVAYTADENGYQPQGDHLPTPHPIPEEILKSIEQNAQAAAAGTQEGAYNPNEDNSFSNIAPLQYNNKAPSSYDQANSAQIGYNKQQEDGASQIYGVPNAGASGSRLQSQSGFQPQGTSQQYGAASGNSPNRPFNAGQSAFNKPQENGPSQLYGVSNAGASAFRPQSQSGFQPQGTPQQYGATSRNSPNRPYKAEQSAYNKPQGTGPSQLYGALNTDTLASRPQSQPNFQPQGSFQQYGATRGSSPTRPSSEFSQPQAKAPSQIYSPSVVSNSNSGARPINFGQSQPQGPTQQYGAANGFGPSRPTSGASGFAPSRPVSGTNGFAPSSATSNGYAPSNSASNAFAPSTSSSNGFPSGSARPYQGIQSGRPQAFSQFGQAQDDSGYQYNKPQGSQLGGSNSGRPSNQDISSQYRPQNGAAQPSEVQQSFPLPNGNGGYAAPSQSTQGSFSSSSRPNSQGSFSPYSAPSSQGGPKESSSGQVSSGPSYGSNGQSFGPSSGANGFGRPQGSYQAPSTNGVMPESAGYEYNRPGAESGPQGGGSSQPGFRVPGSSPGQNFGGPRQPPSFSEEEGYKY